MPEKKKTAAADPTAAAPAEAKETKTRKAAKAPARRGRPPLAPELYVEFGGKTMVINATERYVFEIPDPAPAAPPRHFWEKWLEP